MRLVTFYNGYAPRLGALVNDVVVDLQAAYILQQFGSDALPSLAQLQLAQAQLPSDALAFIDLGEPAMARARQLVEAYEAQADTPEVRQYTYKQADVRLLPPILRPGKIIAIGLNYVDHAAESNMPLPKNPVIFAKFATCLVGPGEPVVHPGSAISSKLDYEVELAVIMGKKAKRISVDQALEYVFGYSVMNDISARDLQLEDSQWIKGKALDTFAPFGPALVTADEVPDPQSLDIQLTLNGKIMQSSNTNAMIFSVARIVSYLSQLMTLEPGDVISTGTPPGVGAGRNPAVFLQPGDIMSAEIAQVGVLTNPVVEG
jgi:2-keto-4-pentenoate hydratase/2-oxohepta-3-ene-1,7-dioic acid hydratase in catechol pathway